MVPGTRIHIYFTNRTQRFISDWTTKEPDLLTWSKEVQHLTQLDLGPFWTHEWEATHAC